MEELFIPVHLAKLADRKQYNEPCIAFWSEDNELIMTNTIKNDSMLKGFTAPTYEQILDWFRIKHNIIVEARLYSYSVKKFEEFKYPEFKFRSFVFSFKRGEEGHGVFEDKKEAYEVAIEKAFNLI